MGGNVIDISLFTQKVLKCVQKLVNGDHLVPSEVENIKTNRLERQQRAAGNVIHVGKPTRLFAVASDRDGLSLSNPLAETKHDHVWSASRTIDREVAQNGHIDAVEVMIGVGKSLRAFFAGSVRRQGMLGGGSLGMRRLAFIAVEA